MPPDYFHVTNGVIETVGLPKGYLRTEKTYSDYRLHVEWRYPDEPGNSGIMLQVNGLLQNVASNLSATAGYIGLQAEGQKIQFRNLWIEPLD